MVFNRFFLGGGSFFERGQIMFMLLRHNVMKKYPTMLWIILILSDSNYVNNVRTYDTKLLEDEYASTYVRMFVRLLTS